MLDNHNLVAFAFQTAYDFQQQQVVACIHTKHVRGYAIHPTTEGDANLKIEV